MSGPDPSHPPSSPRLQQPSGESLSAKHTRSGVRVQVHPRIRGGLLRGQAPPRPHLLLPTAPPPPPRQEEPSGPYLNPSKRPWPSLHSAAPRLHAGPPSEGHLWAARSGVPARTTLPPPAMRLQAARSRQGGPRPGSRCTAHRLHSRLLSHFGVNHLTRTPTRPRRPKPTPGPQSRDPEGLAGAEWRTSASPSREVLASPRLYAPLPGSSHQEALIFGYWTGERSPVTLNPKSRAVVSSRDLRGCLHITHNSLSFLSPPVVQDGE